MALYIDSILKGIASMYVLGIHFGSHDTSASLVKDGEIIAVMEQERFDHKKHTTAFPLDAARYCLAEGKIGFEDLAYVACATDPEFTNVQKQKFIESKVSSTLIPAWSNREDIEAIIRRNLSEISPAAQNVPIFSVDHHKAHAASTFYISPYREAAIFTVDGMGNWVTTTGGFGKDNQVETLVEIAHPHSLGLLYGTITQFLGFRAACDESKVMGLASYGRPTFVEQFRELCRYEDKQIKLDLNYFTFHDQPLMRNDKEFNEWYSKKMEDLFGPARKEESELTDRDMDLAHSVQVLLEERAFQLLNDLHEICPTDNLCLAGGVALNSTMNGKISQFTPFKNVFIIPAANDAGLSLGAALYCNAVESPSTFVRHPLDHAYYGSHHSDPEIEAEFKDLPPSIDVSKPADLVGETAKLLNDYNIVGWYQGRMEFGPRALGNRSILANPRKAETKDIVNQKVKFRENFRPFAPMVPLEYVSEYFESNEEMPFMLKIVEVKPEKRSVIPAVTHVDHTARVQTVTPQQNERIHSLLHEMKKLGGVPVLLNTSFNIRGDTIVRTPKDAVKCLLETGLNALAIGPYLLVKKP